MLLSKIISLFLSFCLILEQGVFAQTIDLSHYFSNSSKDILQGDKFRPLHLRYVSYDAETDDFQILLDKGDFFNQKTEKTPELEKTSQELMNYFFIGLALPNEKFWVNLRPDSPDNILDPLLEKTDIGRIFLEADLQLKKDTSGMTSPQTPEGKAYWDKLYKKAGELFNSQNITIPTITRPWIVPAETIIGESPYGAYIYKARLKVMLEEDYLTSRGGSRTAPTHQQYAFSDPRLKELNEYSTQLIKETIIPKLTYAVNSSKRYAPLRQVYYSLILAQWFKQKYSSSGSVRASGTSAPVNSYINLIDSGNLANLTSKEPYDKQAYFQQYQKSFQDGEYNLQEPIYTPTGQNIRRYMSGGVLVEKIASSAVVIQKNNLRPNRDYLIHISNEAASPLNSVEETARELTEALFNPEQENRLFIWRDKITPEVFKKIQDNIKHSLEINTELLRNINIKDITIKLIVRILIDTANISKNDATSSKSQAELLGEIINYALSWEAKNAENIKSHITTYFLKDLENRNNSIPIIHETLTDITKELKKADIDLGPFIPVLTICDLLNEISLLPQGRIELLERKIKYYPEILETDITVYEGEKDLLQMRYEESKKIPMGGVKIFLTGGKTKFSLMVHKKIDSPKYEFVGKNNSNVFYIRNIKTGKDAWILFNGIDPNKFYIGWFDTEKQEFVWQDYKIVVSNDNYKLASINESGSESLLAGNIISMTKDSNGKEIMHLSLPEIINYDEGVKRLLASSSAAEQTDKDPDIQNLSEFVNGLINWEDWNVFYKKAAKNTEKTQKETPIKINGHDYYVRSNLSPPIAEYLKGVVIITSGLTGKKFVLKRLSHTLEAKIYKELSAKGMSVPGVLSLTDELDKKYLLMDYIEGVEIYKGFYNSDGPYNKLKFLFEIFSKKGALDSFVKDIKIMNDYGISHNDLDNFRNMVFVKDGKDGIVFIDFGLAEKNIKNPDNARPFINNLKALIQQANENPKNNKDAATINRYIKFARKMVSRLDSSPASNKQSSDKGGIDFSRPEILSQPIGELQSLADSPLTVNPNLDFEGEWRGIQMVFNSGFRPSARRLAEFAASAASSPGNSQRLEDLQGLVSDLLRRDEEEKGAAPAEPELKGLLSYSY